MAREEREHRRSRGKAAKLATDLATLVAFVLLCMMIVVMVQGNRLIFARPTALEASSGETQPTAVRESVIKNTIRLIHDDRKPDLESVPSDGNLNVSKKFAWLSITEDDIVALDLPINKGAYEYYKALPRYYSAYDYTKYLSDETNKKLVAELVDAIRNSDAVEEYSDYALIRESVRFIQSLEYRDDEKIEWPKYPIETLYEGTGDCEDTCILLVAMVKEIGYDCVLLSYDNHVAVGIPGDDSIKGGYYSYKGTRYYYVETTSENWKIGEVPEAVNGAAVVIPVF